MLADVGEALTNVERVVARDPELGLDLEFAMTTFPPHDGAELAWRFAAYLLIAESADRALSLALEDTLLDVLAKRHAPSAHASE